MIMERFARLRPGDSTRAEKLEDGDGALLFPNERVCDVLFDKGRVVAVLSNKYTHMIQDAGGGKRPTKRIKGAGGGMQVVAVQAYKRDDDEFEYITPTVEEIMDVDTRRQEKRVKCPLCDQMFATASKVAFHIKTHKDHPDLQQAIMAMDENTAFSEERERRFFCPSPNCAHNCDDNGELAHPFMDFPTLRKHFLRIHVAEKPHKCKICGKAYALKSDMQTHEKGCGKAFMCECGKRYSQRSNLNAHIRKKAAEGAAEGAHKLKRPGPPDIAGPAAGAVNVPPPPRGADPQRSVPELLHHLSG